MMVEKMNAVSLRKLKEETQEEARRRRVGVALKEVIVGVKGGCGWCGSRDVGEMVVVRKEEMLSNGCGVRKGGRVRALDAGRHEQVYGWVVEGERWEEWGVWCWGCFPKARKRLRKVESVTKR